MSKWCKKCDGYAGGEFCSRCGNKSVVEEPVCNWCNKKISYNKFCTGCGRTREEALNTEPPPTPETPNFFSRIMKFLKN